MHVTYRSYLTAGVAALGAGAIALGPVQPIPNHMAVAQERAVSNLAVELAATIDPITPWVDTFKLAAENLASLGTMAASVAHEIRNPLAGISGVVQVVASSLPDGDDRQPALIRVQHQIARLGELVGELLVFARPVTASMTAVNLRESADQAAIAAAASVGRSVENIHINGTGEVRGDPMLVTQILQNLMQNALQAGAKTVVVDVKVSAGYIDVIDDGPGINSVDRDVVFQPFFTTKVRGTGLGLPMARRIAEAMTGTLELLPATTESSGCHFRLRLPKALQNTPLSI